MAAKTARVPVETALVQTPDPDLPELPVDLIIEPTQDGARAILRNTSGQPLEVTITVVDPATRDTSTQVIALSGARTTRVEGLQTTAGDRITVASTGYRDRITFVN